MSRFDYTPQVKMRRSKFDLSKGVKTSMSLGRLYPVDCQEVLPGDNFKTKLTAVTRLSSTFIKPVIDNVFMDIYHFFVPYRLIFDESERVFGNPSPSAYIEEDFKEFPSFTSRQSCGSCTVGDYLGLPIGEGRVPEGVSVMPFRAFAKIYNDWFRNENTVDEVYVQKGEYKSSEALNVNPWSANNYTGLPPFVGKKKDYFTSALPAPQKGENVNMPLYGFAPIVSVSDNYLDPSTGKILDGSTVNSNGIYFYGVNNNDTLSKVDPLIDIPLGVGGVSNLEISNSTSSSVVYPNLYLPTSQTIKNGVYSPSMKADLTNVYSANINEQRFAFQLQRMLERDALYGSRYNEYLLGHFGVVSPDARLQLSEYLGGGRIPLHITQVAQTSQSTEDSPLANLSGYSLTDGYSRYSKGFVEHGYVITCACIRQLHTYQQGINKMWTRKARNDFYDPLFATLGEQPIYTSELYTDATTELNDDVFGYNEAWADYRYSPSRISGDLRSSIGNYQINSLDIWHFGDLYTSKPVLSEAFTNETDTFFNRTVSIPSSVQDNFIVDMWFNTSAVRVMPLYSVPGLIDHH